MVLRVKPLPVTQKSLLDQFSVNVLGEAIGVGPSAWAPYTHGENQMKLLALGFGLAF